MKIALAQVNPIVGDLAGNVARCATAAEAARTQGVDLVVLPEMAVPGCPPRDILLDASFVAAVEHATRDLAQRVRSGPPVLVGTVVRVGESTAFHPSLYNAVVLLDRGEVSLAAAKRTLRDDDIYFESRWFTPGPVLPSVTAAGQPVNVRFGSDLLAAQLPDTGPSSLTICLAASHYYKNAFQQRMDSARSTSGVLVYANLVGGNDELIYDGRSFVTVSGKRVAQLVGFREDLAVIDTAARPEIDLPDAEPGGTGELFAALVLGVRDFMKKNRLERAFVGLSGGIDSAVTAAIACEALDPERVTAVSIPSRHTDPRSVESARQLSQALGIGFEVIELEPLHRAAEEHLGALLSEGTGAENLQARLRAVILMAYVNRHGGLLLNTTNKTELSVGYITLYGDMAGMLSPLGDVTKPDVFALARWINARSAVIPAFILARAPTAELAPGQVDPFDYDKVSPELDALVHANQSSDVLRRSEYKRRQMGVILKVSEKAFGSGRLIPITRR